MRFASIIFGLFGLTFYGCVSNPVVDLSSYYGQDPGLQKGYKLGGIYVLQRDLIVGEIDHTDFVFTKPGDGVPTVEQWQSGTRSTQIERGVALLKAGTKVKVEKIIYRKESGSGVSHATGMFRADGIERLINPFAVSDFLRGPPYGILCVPDERFLLNVE